MYPGCTKLHVFLIITLCVIMLSGGNQNVSSHQDPAIGRSGGFAVADYTESLPIVINHDDNFTTQGWPGNGTEDDPFKIQGLNITHSSTCINISHTRVWFEIDQCLLLSSPAHSAQGIVLTNVTNAVIVNCTIQSATDGILANASQNIKIHNCTISGCSSYAINLRKGTLATHAENLTIKSNRIDSCQTAIYTDHCRCNITYNNISGGNDGLWLDHPSECQIYANNLTGQTGIGVMLYVPTYVEISKNRLADIGSEGINIDEDSSHVNVTDNTILRCQSDGILADALKFSRVSHNTVEDVGGSGIVIGGYKPRNVTVEFNEVYGTASYGIKAIEIDNSTIRGNKIEYTGNHDTGSSGLWVSGIGTGQDYLAVEDNMVSSKNTLGVYFGSASKAVFFNNTIAGNIRGVDIYLQHSLISNNSIYQNSGWGMYIDCSEYLNLTGNKVYSNDDDGIYIHYEGANHRAYSNELGWNAGLNAYDGTFGSQWDDGISIGNKWSDYNGTGVYSPDGTAIVDHYPETLIDTEAPVVGHPDDIYYEAGEIGNEIHWALSDDFPSTCTILMNGSIFAEEVWVGATFTVLVDGFDPGHYNLTLIATDGAGNNATDEVWVHVADLIPPTIDSPPDIDYELGTAHFNATWNPQDDYPKSYVLLNNGSVFSEGDWDGSEIVIDVGGLGVGRHNLTLKVFDMGWNMVADTVWLEVHDTVAPYVEGIGSYQYEGGSTGHLITWNASDYAPHRYTVFRNGTPVKSGNWSSGGIVVSVDGLNPFVYNYTLAVNDTSGNPSSNTVIVTVHDTVAPNIVSPDDTSVEAGLNVNLTWSPSDYFPASYQVFVDGTVVKQDDWDGGNITWTIVGDLLETKNVTLRVTDLGGNSAVGSVFVTVIDTTPPEVSQPNDLFVEYGVTGRKIEWSGYDLFPSSYTVLRNGTTIDHITWDGNSVTVEIELLPIGVYNYTIRFYDTSGNQNGTSVIVSVIYNEPPTIDSPDDVKYVEDVGLGFIIWHPSDSNPDRYRVTKNGTLYDEGAWDGSSISVNVSGLLRGVYEFTLTVWDIAESTASNSVIVRVVYETTPPVIDGPADIEFQHHESGFMITWTTYDEHPHRYTIYHNGSIVRSGVWEQSLIAYSLDGLDIGYHNFTLFLKDIDANTARDAVIVIVSPAPPPVIEYRGSSEHTLGSGSNQLVWHAQSDIPSDYAIYINGSLHEQGIWDGNEVVLDVSGFAPGIYEITCVLTDLDGNTATQTITIAVLAAAPPLFLNPTFLTALFVIMVLFIVVMAYRIVRAVTKKKDEEDWTDVLEDFLGA